MRNNINSIFFEDFDFLAKEISKLNDKELDFILEDDGFLDKYGFDGNTSFIKGNGTEDSMLLDIYNKARNIDKERKSDGILTEKNSKPKNTTNPSKPLIRSKSEFTMLKDINFPKKNKKEVKDIIKIKKENPSDENDKINILIEKNNLKNITKRRKKLIKFVRSNKKENNNLLLDPNHLDPNYKTNNSLDKLKEQRQAGDLDKKNNFSMNKVINFFKK